MQLNALLLKSQINSAMLESLLQDLTTLGYTISWAFQFEPNHWRVSICRASTVGEPSGSYISHCADAPTLAEAIEDALSRRAEAEFVVEEDQTYTVEVPGLSLAQAIASTFSPSAPIRRRI